MSDAVNLQIGLENKIPFLSYSTVINDVQQLDKSIDT